MGLYKDLKVWKKFMDMKIECFEKLLNFAQVGCDFC